MQASGSSNRFIPIFSLVYRPSTYRRTKNACMFSQQKNIRLFWDLFFPAPTNNFATQFIICTSSVDMLGLRLDIFIKHARDKRGLFTVFACVCVCLHGNVNYIGLEYTHSKLKVEAQILISIIIKFLANSTKTPYFQLKQFSKHTESLYT